ncbi:hypothetical protein [Agrococcus beijingensis]|uniref:hypothetical protein n=1 Tax=Agrococcus beijingensis TaxID=3068634 RepID=UPI002742161D|nr:hypothetical protein [Agrococcus sp. REN33]
MNSTLTRSAALSAALIASLGLSACFMPPNSLAASTPADSAPSAETEEAAAEPAAAEPTTSSAAAAAAAAEQGTRDNPWRAGDELVTDEWELVVGATNLDANAVVADGNMFNDPPEPGFQYIQVPLSVTYVGDESASTMEIQVAYVAASGETYEAWDASVAVPDDNQMQELYSGGSASFNEYLMVPSEGIADGLLRVEVGMIGGAQGFVTLD